MEDKRVSWDEYFMKLAHLVKERSTCIGRQVGAVIIKDKRIIATGYNGAPRGTKHCAELGGCLRRKLNVPRGERHELCRATHAEQNAIISAAVTGSSIQDATMYVTVTPCVICAKMIINAGIKEIVFEGEYPDEFAMELLNEAGIKLRKYPNESR
jgi:dCMP deaminase